MKFTVEVSSKCSGRIGCLMHPESGKKFQTPLLMQSTKGGSIPHLSWEVFSFVTKDVQVLQINLATCNHMGRALEIYGKGIASYVGCGESPIFLTIKDPCEIAPTGFNEKDMIPLFTRRGKATITVDRYMNLVKLFKPDIYAALSDSDTNIDSPKKRILNSVERTEQFFKNCLEVHKASKPLEKSLFFAPIVGGYCKDARSKSIKAVLQAPEVGGFLIEGLHNNGKTASKIKIDALKDVISHCINELDKDRPKMVSGAYTPIAVLEMIKLGIDIFDTSYIYTTTSNFHALTFNFNIQSKKDSDCFNLDLNDEKFKGEFNPIVADCNCLTCKKHTRAYVHHLIKTKELLGPILLMIHNTHHYMLFFETIRKLISTDELQQLINLIEEQIKDEVITEKDTTNCPTT